MNEQTKIELLKITAELTRADIELVKAGKNKYIGTNQDIKKNL